MQIGHDAVLYKKRHKVENMFGRLKDWRRIAMRFDRRADIFLSACVLAAIVLFWICVLSLVPDAMENVGFQAHSLRHPNAPEIQLSPPDARACSEG